MWIAVFFFLGSVILATRLLSDPSLESVVRLDEIPQTEHKQQDPSPSFDPVRIESIVPEINLAPAGSSWKSSDIGKNEEEDLWEDEASAWGSLSTNYGDVVANETIHLISERASRTYTEISDENGYFSFEKIVAASDYRLSVSPKGMYKRVSMDSLAILNNQTTLTIVLEPLEVGTLKGKVVNTEGIVVPGYEMRIQSPLKARWVRRFVPNIIGAFEIENVPIGSIEFTKTFGQALMITGHKFSGESQSIVELVVDVGNNELRGVVYDEFNNTVPGATAILEWRHSYQGGTSIVTRRSTTNPTGEFLFQGLGKGEHELLVTSFDGLVARQVIDIGNASPERVVDLQRK